MGEANDVGQRRDGIDATTATVEGSASEPEGAASAGDARPEFERTEIDLPRPVEPGRRGIAWPVGLLLVLTGLTLAWFPRVFGLGIAGDALVRLDAQSMQSEQGFAFTIPIELELESDSGGTSPLVLLEDGQEMGTAHALHQAIREQGGGRYSHWGKTLYFSTADGSDPRTNGRVYALRVPQMLTPRWPLRLPLACIVLLLGFLLAATGQRNSPSADTPEACMDPVHPSRLRMRDGAFALCIGLGLALYVAGASIQSEVMNTDRVAGDQSAYLAYTMGMIHQGDSFLGERNRMPAVPTLMRLVASQGLDAQVLFECAKTLQIAISIVLLAVVFLVCRSVMPRELSLVVCGVAAFLVFAFKAGWVQAELLSYTLALATMATMVMALARSSPWLALLAGVTAGLSHLTKASAPPAVLLFLVLGGFVAVAAWVRRSTPVAVRIRRTLVPVLLVAGFLLVLWPYISESKRVFGAYFYNVNSTFYMWYDSWDECLAGTGAHDDFHEWPDMPADQIPGPGRWFEQNGVGGAVERLELGATRVWESLEDHSYGYLDYAFALPFLALTLLLGRPRRSWARWREHLASVAFVVCYLVGYAILYFWYAKVIAEQRFILSLLLPLLWASGLVLAHCESWYPVLTLRRRRVSVVTVLVLLLAGLLVADIHTVLTDRVWTINGGS